MTRFIDDLDKTDPRQAHVAQLLEAGTPFRESEVSRERVRRALRQVEMTSARSRLRPALAAAVLFGLAGTAGAAWGVAQLVQSPAIVRPAPSPDAANSARVSPATPRSATPTASQSGGAPAPKQVDRVTEEAKASPAERPPSGHLERDSVVVQKPRPTSHASPQSKQVENRASELVLLHRATEALRSSNDPEKAAELLRRYEASRGSGALDEEALALRIEAALAGKSPEAATLAHTYLSRYPNGRFRPLAERAVQQRH